MACNFGHRNAHNSSIRLDGPHECCIERLRAESTYNTVTCIPSEFNSSVGFNQLNRRERPAWQTAGYKSRIYSLLRRNVRHFQYNAVVIQSRRPRRRRRRGTSSTSRGRLVRMYNEPRRYRLTNVINVINILSSAVFIAGTLELSEWILFSVRDEPCQPAIQHVQLATRILHQRRAFDFKYSPCRS